MRHALAMLLVVAVLPVKDTIKLPDVPFVDNALHIKHPCQIRKDAAIRKSDLQTIVHECLK
jgi:hypothetical protein